MTGCGGFADGGARMPSYEWSLKLAASFQKEHLNNAQRQVQPTTTTTATCSDYLSGVSSRKRQILCLPAQWVRRARLRQGDRAQEGQGGGGPGEAGRCHGAREGENCQQQGEHVPPL